MTVATWPTAQRIRAKYLEPLPEKRNDKLLNAACKGISADVAAFLAEHDTAAPERHWWTCQFVSGGISGRWAETELEARVEIELWWGEEIAWIVVDDDAEIQNRYWATVKVKDRQAGRVLFDLTEGPAEYPVPTGDLRPVSVQPTLFDLFEMSGS